MSATNRFSLHRKLSSCLVVPVAILAGCAEPPAETPMAQGTPQRSTSAAHVSAPLDVQSATLTARIALRPDGARWLGEGLAHRLVATADGLDITPLVPATSAATSPRAGAPFRIKAAGVARGERSLNGTEPAVRVEKGNHLVVARGEFTQHIDNREEGVEISYAFAHAPEGKGDLRVVLDVAGETFARRTSEGLHYVDASTGAGVRFGRATWIDANGKKSPVAVHAQGSQIEMRVPGAVLASSAYPAVLDPLISPEFGVDTPAYSVGSKHRFRPLVAWNGTHYLVAWQDGIIHGIRFTDGGAQADPVDFPLTTVGATGHALASDGVGFFMTYTSNAPGLHGQHYDGNGQPVGAPIDITTTSSIWTSRLTFDGANYVAVWERLGVAYRARITPAGQLLDPGGVSVAPAESVDIASNGAGSYVTWLNGGRVFGSRLDAQGTLLDPAGIPLTPNGQNEWAPAVGWSGQHYFVAYENYDAFEVFGTRVDPQQGTPVDVGGFFIGGLPFGYDPKIEVGGDGVNAVVAWTSFDPVSETYPMWRMRVSPQGMLLDPSGVTVASSAYDMDATTNGADAFMVWEAPLYSYFQPEAYVINTQRFGQDGSALAPLVTIQTGTNNQRSPAAAFDGQNFLVAWIDDRNFATGGRLDVYAARLSPGGVILDPNGINVAGDSSAPSDIGVIFDGTNFLLGWSAYFLVGDAFLSTASAARVSPQGAVLQSIPISGLADCGFACTLSAGSNGDALFAADTCDSPPYGVLGAKISGAGQVTDINPASSQFEDSYVNAITSSFDGTNHLLVWQRTFDNNVLRAVLVNAQGAAVVAPFTLADSLNQGVSAAYDGTNHVVFWGSGTQLLAARVSPAGVVLDASPVVVATSPGCNVLLSSRSAVTQGNWIVVGYKNCGQGTPDISAVVLGANLSVLTSFDVTSDSADESKPSLAVGNGGKLLFAYSRYQVGLPYSNSTRAFARTVDLTACSADADCNGGTCSNGICSGEGNGTGGTGGSGGMGGSGGSGGMGGTGGSGGSGGMGGSGGSGGTGGTGGSGGMGGLDGAGGSGGQGGGGGPGGHRCAYSPWNTSHTPHGQNAPLVMTAAAMLVALVRRRLPRARGKTSTTL